MRMNAERIGAAMGVFFVIHAIQPARAQIYSVIHTFQGSSDGASPGARLIADSAGDLYGTTSQGGSAGCFGYGCGAIFEIDSTGNESILHAFSGDGYGTDGEGPNAVVRDAAGNLYGTTYHGGQFGEGTIFELTSKGSFSLLRSLASGTLGTDGESPLAGLAEDAAGNLYGSTFYGGAYGNGAVFKLNTAGRFAVLHSFDGAGGQYPLGDLVLDLAGNIYGTTVEGGSYGHGAVFKLDSTGDETLLYSFMARTDGSGPNGSLTRDLAGNLYGSTQFGGTFGGKCYVFGCGLVFKVDPSGNETVLYSFNDSGGSNPFGGVVRDGRGNLYGVTEAGGAYGRGVVFKINPSGTETVLHAFKGGTDGEYPVAGLLLYNGYLYGTTSAGGLVTAYCGGGCGVVFKLSP